MFLAEGALIGIVGSLIEVPTDYELSHFLSYVLSGFVSPQQNHVFQEAEVERATVVPVFSLPWTIVAVVFAIAICILFGLYPARKAAKTRSRGSITIRMTQTMRSHPSKPYTSFYRAP